MLFKSYPMINTECGIFGVISKNQITSIRCIEGMKNLQHRGRESYGISYFNNNKFTIEKEYGFVRNTIDTSIISNLWLGHVRYSTYGSNNNKKFTQPIYDNNKTLGEYIIAHNGNIPTYIWEKLQDKYDGCLDLNLVNNSDTTLLREYITFLVNLEKIINWRDIIVNIIDTIGGAYSIVIQTEKYTYLFRDSGGFKPLLYLRDDNTDAIIISSENYFLMKSSQDVESGSILKIDNKTFEINTIYKKKNIRKNYCAFEYLYFLRPNNIINNIDVNDFRKKIGVALSKQLSNSQVTKWKDAIVCGVPRSGLLFAKSFSSILDLDYQQFLQLNENYQHRSFILKTNKERLEACHRKFKLDKASINGKKIILIDDSIVRGNTLSYLISYLREGHPSEIHFISASPPIKSPCYFGIDFADIEELIVNRVSPDKLAEYYGIDSLMFLDIDNLQSKNMCRGCFTGDYPI